jgi:hypothetical protein
MPITLSKIKYGTRSIVHFEALEQTLRLRLVSGPVDKKFFFLSRNSLSHTHTVPMTNEDVLIPHLPSRQTPTSLVILYGTTYSP